MKRTSWLWLLAVGAALLFCSACWGQCCFAAELSPAGENPKDGAASAAGAPRAAQALCPITGVKRADAAAPVAVEIDGFRFWVADQDAAEKAKGDPAAAFKALAENGDVAEPAVWVCPAMGNKIDPKLLADRDPKTFVDRGGKRIYMCCPPCRGKIENNWDAMCAQLAQWAKDGASKE